MISTELVQELQLLQNSRSNQVANEMSERIMLSVDAVNEKLSSSFSGQGSMLMALEKRFNFRLIRKFKLRFFK